MDSGREVIYKEQFKRFKEGEEFRNFAEKVDVQKYTGRVCATRCNGRPSSQFRERGGGDFFDTDVDRR